MNQAQYETRQDELLREMEAAQVALWEREGSRTSNKQLKAATIAVAESRLRLAEERYSNFMNDPRRAGHNAGIGR